MAGYSVTFTVVDQATKQIDAINRRVAAIRAPIERMSRTISRFVDVTGLRKIADGFEWIGKAAMGVARSLVEIVPLMGTITGAASIAGMLKLVGSYAGWERQLATTADTLGMTTQQVELFENAAKLAGASAADMDSAMGGLYDNANKFIRGQAAPEMQQWMIKLGLNVRDAHGRLKPLNEMMPEFVDRIARIENPADRAAAANALLGASGDKVVEAFRTAHTTMGQSIEDARQYSALTDEEKRKLEDFQSAQNKLGVEFDTLGKHIAAMSAEHLVPLMNWFNEFVQQHTPDILKAVGQVEDKFSEWFKAVATWLADPGNWDKVVKDLQAIADVLVKIIDSVKWLIEHSQWMFKTPEELLGLQKGALDPNAWGKALHDRIVGGAKAAGAINQEANPAAGLAPPGQAPQQSGGWWARHAPTWLGGNAAGPPGTPSTLNQGPEGRPLPSREFNPIGSDWIAHTMGQQGGGGQQPGAPVGMAEQQENLRRAMDEQGITDPQMRAGIAAIASGEGGFKPRSESGYGNTSNDRIRRIFGAKVGDLSDAQLTALKADDKAFFDKVYGGRLGNAADEGYMYRGRGDFQLTGKGNYDRYGKMIGVDLVNNPDLVNDPAISAKIAVAYMKDRYHGGGFEGMKRAVGNSVAETEAVKNKNFAQYLATGEFAAPAQVAQAGAPNANVPQAAPASGNVDVTVTHKNAPTNTSVSATGSGQGVNVAPPRVEYQDFAAI